MPVLVAPSPPQAAAMRQHKNKYKIFKTSAPKTTTTTNKQHQPKTTKRRRTTITTTIRTKKNLSKSRSEVTNQSIVRSFLPSIAGSIEQSKIPVLPARANNNNFQSQYTKCNQSIWKTILPSGFYMSNNELMRQQSGLFRHLGLSFKFIRFWDWTRNLMSSKNKLNGRNMCRFVHMVLLSALSIGVALATRYHIWHIYL